VDTGNDPFMFESNAARTDPAILPVNELNPDVVEAITDPSITNNANDIPPARGDYADYNQYADYAPVYDYGEQTAYDYYNEVAPSTSASGDLQQSEDENIALGRSWLDSLLSGQPRLPRFSDFRELFRRARVY